METDIEVFGFECLVICFAKPIFGYCLNEKQQR